MLRVCAFFSVLLALSFPIYAEGPTIYRDTFGIPHIYAKSNAAAAYAVGYAQAEDRLEDIYLNIRTAIGEMAEYFGPDHVEVDYAMKMAGNPELSQKSFDAGSAEAREVAEYYIKGVQAYAAEHPERVPEYAMDLYPWHCAAVGRAMILRWPLGTLFDDLGGKSEEPAFSSNSYVIAPERTADGSAILLTDPHLTWESLAVFHEARVHAPDLEMCGFWIVGTPLVGLGHNGHVGWAMTTGGADTSDVYMLKFKMGFPPKYEYDGEWLMPKMKTITIKVKGEEKPRKMPALYTIHGPLLEEPDAEHGVAYAGKTPYMDDTGYFEQGWRMSQAKTADEFYTALKMDSLMEQNIMYADRKGNIGYVRVGRTPIRPEGYDWHKPVPGNTSATEWLGFYDLDDHVRIVNPAAGYMQNCNVSPENMMIDSPMTPDQYNEHVYNVSWDFDNPRGKRLNQLLDADDSVTKEEAKAIAMDVYDLLAKPWQQALQAAAESDAMAAHTDDSEMAAAVDAILAWNGEFTQDSTIASLIREWRLRAQDQVDVKAVAEKKALSAEEQRALLATLREAKTFLKDSFGTYLVPWGETHIVGRNGDMYPYDGADFGKKPWNFTETVRDVETKPDPDQPGRNVAYNGSMSAMLMFMNEDGIEAYTCTPWGNSNQPDSPHHTDQTRELYSQRKWKSTWFTKDALLENLESEKVLDLP